MTPRRLRLLGLGTLALVLTACTINFNTVIQPDGSGIWKTEFGLNEQDISMLESSGSSAEQFCNDMESDLPEGGSIALEERGQERWCVASAPFATLDDLRTIYEEMDGVTVNALAIEGGEFVYDLVVDMSSEGNSPMGGFTPSMTWIVTAPGRVIETNATQQDGQQLSWSMTTDQPLSATVRSNTTAGGLALPGLDNPRNAIIAAGLGLCCCTAVLGGAGGGAFVLVRRRQQRPPGTYPHQ
jgi:hypothetical protein